MLAKGLLTGFLCAMAFSVGAQTVRIGIVNTFSGPQASFGEMNDRAMRLYIKMHEKELPQGQLANVELETVARAVKDPWKEMNRK